MSSTKLKKIEYEEYDIIDCGDENFHRVLLKETSAYPGVLFQFGKVNFVEENDSLRVKFEYEVFDNPNQLNTKSDEFIEYIGRLLMTCLEEILLLNEHKRTHKEFDDN